MADIAKVGATVRTTGTSVKSAYWSGKTKFEKLGNGTDFGAIVKSTVKQQGFHQRRLEKWRAQWVKKSDSLKDLNTKMTTLSTALSSLDSIGEFMGRKTTCSHPSYLTATASSDAPVSPYKVEINQLAQNDIWTSSSGFASNKAIVSSNASHISISAGGKTANMDIPGGTTVQGLIKMVNATSELKGRVQVEAIKTGGEYRLKFTSLKMGVNNRITFNPSTTLGALTSSNLRNLQQGQNSKIKIDGFPDGDDNWIERDSNMITDASKGLTLNLKGVTTPSKITVNVTTDTEKMLENVKKFVKEINVVRKALKDIVQYNKTTKKGSIMTGNYGVQLASQRFKNVTATAGQGFANYNASTGAGDRFNTLAAVGIKTQSNEGSVNFGMLELDEVKFKKAMREDPDGVAALFSANYVPSTNSPSFSVKSVIKGITKPGKHDISYTVAGGRITSATINGERAKINGWEITATKTAASGMAIRIDNHTDGDYSGFAGVKSGKAVEMINTLTEMTNAKTGTLNIIKDNYQGIIKNIDKKITYEKNRLAKLEKNLKAKYARLDKMLALYGGKLSTLKSQIAKLGKSK